MARVVKLVSDVTGNEADEAEFVNVVVREHPKLSGPKQLDVISGELDSLRPLTNMVVLEIGVEGGKHELVVSYDDFKKLVADKVVQSAPNTRGRRKGFSPAKS